MSEEKKCNICKYKHPNYHSGHGFCYMFFEQFNSGDICAQFVVLEVTIKEEKNGTRTNK